MIKKNNRVNTKIYFMPIGICLGMIIGAIVGINIKSVFMTMCIAIIIGAVLGLIIDNILRK